MDEELLARQQPQSLEAEQSVLGAILIDSRCVADVVGILKPEDFYLSQNREIYETIYTMFNFSQTIDPVTVLDKMKELGYYHDNSRDYIGQLIHVTGQFRSYNRHEEKKNRLVLSVFVRELEFLDEIDEDEKTNQIFLDGYICKEPIYRKTPLGREIADVLLAVNRSYGKSDYIPCICWGRNARFAAGFEVGSHIQMYGRIQSREYVKKISETETERRVAYEVSVSKVDLIPEE